MPFATSLGAVGGYAQRAVAPTAVNPLFGRALSRVYSVPGQNADQGVVVKYDQNGRTKWVAAIDGAQASVTCVRTDSEFNVIACVNVLYSPVKFYNADGTLAKTLTTTGSEAFLVKYKSDGTLLWTALLQTTSVSNIVDQYNAIGVDSSGNIYATGRGGGLYNSDGTLGGTVPNGTSVGSSFLVKYNASGFVQWFARHIPGTSGTSSSATGFALAIDPIDGSVVVGGSWGSASASVGLSIYHAGETGALFGALAGNQGSLAWLAKYNSSGTVQWIARPAVVPSSVNNSTVVRSLAIDSEQSVYVGGRGGGTASVTITVFNADGTTFGTLASTGLDGFLVKYTSAGTVILTARVTGNSTALDSINGIAVGPNDDLYAVGEGRGGPLTAWGANSGSSAVVTTVAAQTAFLAKYTASSFVARNITRIAPAGITGQIANGTLNAVAADRVGGIIVGGSVGSNNSGFSTTATGFGGNTLITAGRVGLAKYDSSGTVQWIQRWEGSVSSITTDVNCDIYVGGALVALSGGAIYDCDNTVYGSLPSAPAVAPFMMFLIKYSSYPHPQWVAKVEVSTNTKRTAGVGTDSDGNVYTTLVASGTVTLYSVTSAAQSLITPGGSAAGSFAFGTRWGILLTKYNASGTVQWFATVRSSTSNIGLNSLRSATDPNGNTYIAFDYTTSVSVFNASGTSGGGLSIIGAGDVGIVKYNSSGTPQWVARMGTSGSADNAYDLKTDSSGNVHIIGTFGITGTFTIYGSDGVARPRYSTRGSNDAIVVKFNTNGLFQWDSRISSTAADQGFGIACDGSGSVIATGYGSGIVSATNSNGTNFATTLSNEGGTDTFIVKYNVSGTVQWIARNSSTNSDYGTCVVTDSANAVYVGGYANGGRVTVWNASGTAGPTSSDISTNGGGYIAKYNSTGTAQWIMTTSTPDRQPGGNMRSLLADSADGLYARSYTGANVVINGDGTCFGSVSYPTTTANGFMLLKFDTTGKGVWITSTRTVPASGNDADFALDSSRNIYMFHNT